MAKIGRSLTGSRDLVGERSCAADAGKAGVGKDAASATRMSLDEAYKILGVEKNASLEEVLKVSSPGSLFEAGRHSPVHAEQPTATVLVL